MAYLPTSIDFPALALSHAIACFTFYVILDLTRRVRTPDRTVAHLWWIGGSIAGGTGLWTMHFIGIQAQVLPIPVGHAVPMTFVSWLAALGAVGLALRLAMHRKLTRFRVVGGAFVIGAVLCVMHQTGMASIELSPPMVWNLTMIAVASALGMVLAAALLVSFALIRDGTGFARQAIVSIALGLGFGGMHLLAMDAARVPANAICLSVASLNGPQVGHLALLASTLLLGCTLLSSIGYGWLDRRRAQLVTSLECAEARLRSADSESREKALLDSLTGLPNRLGFEHRLDFALARIERAQGSVPGRQEKLAVLFIDIDGFKPVHESLGHAGSDEVVCEVSRRVSGQAGDRDTVARLGSDQFLILMEGVAATGHCVELATRVIEAAKVPFHVAERRVQVSVSIGIVVYPDHGEARKLLAHADTAMQAAKRAGRGTYAVFEPHMHKEAADQLDLIGDLRQAIERGELELHYQPKIDGLRGVICGVEALLRWNHPVRGSVHPGVFIPVAERFGFINTLGDWVIDEACRQMQSWARAGVQMRVAINLSVHQLHGTALVSRITAAMARHGVKSSHLLCEITESVAMQDLHATQRTLDALRKIGVYISIDDFGTGYSSLSYLRQLPVRQLKIDRSFIKDLDTGDHARAIVDAVVSLAHALGLRVVAEGVETARQRDILLDLGCDELQGFFYAHAMPADSLLEWTAGKKPKGTVDFACSLVHEPIGA